MEKVNEADPIWGQIADAWKLGPDNVQFASDRTGKFTTTPDALRNYVLDWSPAERAKLSTWILEQNRSGVFPELKPDDLISARNRRSLSIGEKIDRFLLMLESLSYRPGDPLPWTSGIVNEATEALKHKTMHWTEMASDAEYNAFKEILQDAGILNFVNDRRPRLDVTAIERMERIRSGNSETLQAFVAMWFSSEMDDAFGNGIEPALSRAGYRAQRIDRKEHSNKIDDEIIAEIRRSKFVVADFTCELLEHDQKKEAIARGGVYYEAGFALGLGLPVIWSVRKDLVDFVHFDTRQYNHIVWSSPEELAEKLYNRVAAVIGEGATTG
jgi:hypothetical protein